MAIPGQPPLLSSRTRYLDPLEAYFHSIAFFCEARAAFACVKRGRIPTPNGLDQKIEKLTS
jgi:hypothetical protein